MSSRRPFAAVGDTRTITFIVTEECQLRCTYCYLVGKNKTGRMSFDVAKRTIDYIFSESRLNSEQFLVLDFIGGEPLLEINLIDEIVKYMVKTATNRNHHWKQNFSIRITTNGLLYSSREVQKFIKNYHDHLQVSISIDGNEAKMNSARIFPDGSGSYDAVVKSIPLWRRQFPFEGTKMTISHDDLPFVYDSIRHLIALGIYKIDVNPVLENVWQSGDDLLLEDQLVKCADFIIDNNLYDKVDLSCFDTDLGMNKDSGAHYNYGICGSFTFAVDYRGIFYTCLRFAKFSLRSKEARPIGNIEYGVNWNYMRPYQVFCNQITSQKCLSCDLSYGCKVCPAENYDSSSTSSIYDQSFAACLMHRAKVKAKNYYRTKLSLAVLKYE